MNVQLNVIVYNGPGSVRKPMSQMGGNRTLLWQDRVHLNFHEPTTTKAIPSAAASPVAVIANQKATGDVSLWKSFTRP